MAVCGRNRVMAISAVVLTLGVTASWAIGNINLEFEAVAEPCVSRELKVEFYAVSDSAGNQSTAAMDVILKWDPTVLKLLGIDTTGPYPYPWLFSGFPDDSGLDGLNNTWEDGDALYTALAQLAGGPAYATPPPGLLVTRFKFRKLRVGSPTDLEMLPDFGLYTRTVVYDGFIPGKNVTGTIDLISLLPDARGDINCDGVVDFDDIDPFVLSFQGQAAFNAVYPGCNWYNADVNCDGQVNFNDIDPWVGLLGQ